MRCGALYRRRDADYGPAFALAVLRELLRQEIADTVADPAEAESELRFLAAVLTKKERTLSTEEAVSSLLPAEGRTSR